MSSKLQPEYVLRLYITGATHHSMLAVKNVKAICDRYLKNNVSLEIIDVYQQPGVAQSEDIIAAPTLVKLRPEPVKKLIGDLSDTATILNALGVEP